jgi:EAL domain-containing protein (putative c-di-GMP-specific phosphodiesterase class I)
VAEETGLIVGIGDHVLDQVCTLLAARPNLPGPVSVNVSAVQFARAGFSSIALLRDLPVTGLKLDARFVADLS